MNPLAGEFPSINWSPASITRPLADFGVMRSVVLALVVLTSACTFPSNASETTSDTATPLPAEDGVAIDDDAYPAPEFPEGLDWLNVDSPLALQDLEGRFVLLDFWTYGCINCIHVIPDLHRLEDEFADELVVIGVHSAKFETEGDTESIREILLRYGVEHPVVNDAGFEIWRSYDVRAWPTAWLIDPDGNLVGRHEGEGVYDTVQPVLEGLLAEPGMQLSSTELTFAPEQRVETVLAYPTKLAVDPVGDRIFVADTGHDQVVAVQLSTGSVTAVYGDAVGGYRDGGPDEAKFDGPRGLALSADGTALYVADTGNHAVREIDLESGLVTTLAGTGRKGAWPPMGGFAGGTPLHSPWDLELVDDTLFVAMAGSHQIWSLDLSDGEIAPYAGSGREATDGGPRLASALAQPSGLATDGERLWFADSESSSIRLVVDDEVALLAGAADDLFTFDNQDGIGSEARFQHPLGVAWDGESVWVADTYNSSIRAIDPETGATTTYAGGEAGWGDGAEPLFNQPGGIEAADGLLYVADTNNHAVRVIDLASGETDTLILAGMEQFRRPAEDGVVVAEPATLVEGDAEIVLDVTFPAGYKVNPEAPASFVWSAGVGEVDPASLTAIAPEFPMTFDLRVEASGTLVGDIGLVYCEVDKESICLFEQIQIEVPVVVDPAGGAVVAVHHEVTLPEGLEP